MFLVRSTPVFEPGKNVFKNKKIILKKSIFQKKCRLDEAT
jgi:hypothetical protein